MAITSRLSRKLHETFGQEAAEDLVDWMRGIDTQRAELRELNELSVSRLEARMDARIGELRAEMHARFARCDVEFQAVRGEMATGFAKLEAKIEQRFGELMKWSFLFWIGSTATIVGAVAALDRLLR